MEFRGNDQENDDRLDVYESIFRLLIFLRKLTAKVVKLDNSMILVLFRGGSGTSQMGPKGGHNSSWKGQGATICSWIKDITGLFKW